MKNDELVDWIVPIAISMIVTIITFAVLSK